MVCTKAERFSPFFRTEIFKSAMLPCKLEFRLSSASYKRTLPSSYYFKTAGNGGEERGSYRVIFKVGNDLRQDQGKLTKMIFYELLRNTIIRYSCVGLAERFL